MSKKPTSDYTEQRQADAASQKIENLTAWEEPDVKASSPLDLQQIRQEIDSIDRQMAALYQKRMNASRRVALYKQANNLPVLDAAREAKVIEKNLARLEDPALASLYEDFLRELMRESRILQKSILADGKVAYCGVEGAFAYMSAERMFPGAVKLAKRSFDEVFEAVASRQAQYGVIPLENSNSGLVGEVLDALLKWPVYIVQAFNQHIEQCLLGLPQAGLKDIERVYSKDQALAQCADFLKQLDVETVPYPNTAVAAQFVAAEGNPAYGAIGAQENAALYGLKVLAKRIEADPSNTTRFLVIAAQPLKPTHSHFGMLVSSFNQVGSLGRIIDVLGSFGLNMDTLQSRPIKGHPFEYFFFIQGAGKLDEQTLSELLEALEPVCPSMKWLGSYDLEQDSNQKAC